MICFTANDVVHSSLKHFKPENSVCTYNHRTDFPRIRGPPLNVFSAASTFVLNNEEVPTKVPNYRVELGFGLHVGWAVEGAIGSEFKIDATYLSPDVNLAMGLELATKLYRSQILMSN